MKRRWKIFWIVCAAAAVIGAACLAVGFAMGADQVMIQEGLPHWIGPGRNELHIDTHI